MNTTVRKSLNLRIDVWLNSRWFALDVRGTGKDMAIQFDLIGDERITCRLVERKTGRIIAGYGYEASYKKYPARKRPRIHPPLQTTAW